MAQGFIATATGQLVSGKGIIGSVSAGWLVSGAVIFHDGTDATGPVVLQISGEAAVSRPTKRTINFPSGLSVNDGLFVEISGTAVVAVGVN